MEHQNIIYSNKIDTAIANVLAKFEYNKLFIIVDVNVDNYVMPSLSDNEDVANATKIVIKSGDVNKNLESLVVIWNQLGANGATRRSLVLNIGGGVVTDIGGFAASTFKRGIRFINIPTTLLAAVDAAIGGKTGINFNGLKNEIGTFCEASAVIISTVFFNTLPLDEIKSGYAEMVKHGLLKGKSTVEKLLKYDFTKSDIEYLLDLLKESVEVKREIVTKDPCEKGIRRALNLGHTVGHAFESIALKRFKPIPHGYAVAFGLIVELVLSHNELNFDTKILNNLAEYVRNNYGVFHITCDDYEEILNLMHHDKKSNSGELNFTLLKSPGDVKINCTITEDDAKIALDIYRDLMHI